jgi:elongator complex protein 1
VDLQITLNEHYELLEEIIDPAVFEARNQITEDLSEMREQLQKQVARLRELRIKKLEEPGLLIVLYFLALASARDAYAL